MSFPECNVSIEKNLEERSHVAWHHKFLVHNQNYVVMSIVDTGKPPAAIKIFGTYATVEEANAASEEISAQNDFFDVYVADTNAWLPVPCGRDFVEDTIYQNDKMNQIKEGFAIIKEKNARAIADNIRKDREDKKERSLSATTTAEQLDCAGREGVSDAAEPDCTPAMKRSSSLS